MASQKIKTDAQNFFNQVIQLTTKIEVHQACNELKEQFVEKGLAVGTISKYLTDYKAPFTKVKTHDNPELIENVTVKGVQTTQHIAYHLLDLSDEQKEQLYQQRAESSQKKRGFDDDGELRDISNIPKIDVTEIIKMSVECLTSENPVTIACGIINLTGLRGGEQNMPKHVHKEAGLIEHKMVAVSEYEIAFKGILKKPDVDDSLAFYKRPTLIPAKMIVDAQEKYLQSRKIQEIPSDIEKYQQGFYQNVNNEYKKLFGKVLSTLDAFDKQGNLNDDKGNGTSRRGRGFYACALRAILRLNRFGSSAINKVVQLSLAHDSEGVTMIYLGKYDESLFINPPKYINIATNIKEYGKMTVAPVVTVEAPVKSFNLDNFIDGLKIEENFKFIEFLDSGMSQTQAILALIESIKSQQSTTKTDKPKNTEKPRSQCVKEIVEGIMEYNREGTDGNIELIAIPSYGLINKIAEIRHGKTIAPTTINSYFKMCYRDLDEELKDMGIDKGMEDKAHNNKCFNESFKNTFSFPELAAKILEYTIPD